MSANTYQPAIQLDKHESVKTVAAPLIAKNRLRSFVLPASVIKSARVFINKIKLVRDIQRPHKLPYDANVLYHPEITEARQLLANRYLELGTISEDYLDENRTLKTEHDPYVSRATYFGVRHRYTSKLNVTGRFIHPNEHGASSLQLHLEDLESNWRKWLEAEVRPNEVVEFASLVKAGSRVPSIATMFLFRKMLQHSFEKDIKYWVFGLNQNLQRTFEARFGDSLQRMGETVRLGNLRATYIPYVLDIEKSRENFSKPKSSMKWLRRIGLKSIEKFMLDSSVTKTK